MMKRSRLLFGFAVIALLFLALSNPREGHYLQQVSDTYGAMHHGMNFSHDQLRKIGISDRHSFLFFSTYSYQFGTIRVDYFGIGTIIFHLGSETGINAETPARTFSS